MSIPSHRRNRGTREPARAPRISQCLGVIGAAALYSIMLPATYAGEILSEAVEPVSQPVSLSVNNSQPAATFRAVLKNTGSSNTINRPRFVATSSVLQGGVMLDSASAVFSAATNYTCTVTNVAGTSIDCALPSLAPGESASFTVTFIAPAAGDKIQLAWQAVFDQGTPPGGSNGDAGTVTLDLAPVDANGVKSDVPANLALSFFTGTGIATKSDPWVTKVKLPETTVATTATVEENLPQYVTTCAQAGDLTTCNTSVLSIPLATFGTPGTRPLSQFLEITLLRDASTISKGAKISSAIVYYRKTASDALGLPVPSCALRLDLPKPGEPCEDVSQRTEYPRRNTGKTPVEPGYESDWKFVIYAYDNGRYDQ